ncbi:conserved exported protein of unknown function [Acidithiobacillus ferrivorans]|uniref:Conjugal transfer protein TrbJ n=1 Tax=Acidithiobacillus ferrivorans TaxID=160808 RepID=A0A060UUK9_9PROT|nr:hypothetical protein [Acidithiobacillus ferrivorans]CDQ12095.1 conserved exported hypothetical protein [Acidithiobacillus ferrivorans]SMH64778.1 conserved exported protein of unknown function [Acidithiobacillus ferrivorans]
MWKLRKPSISSVAVATALTLLGINLIPAAHATAIIGATFPQQVVQEMTSLQQYSQNVTAAMADVQTKMNTLNQYTTDLQNLASMPANAISKVTMPYQQAMYDYQQATGLMNEYQYMYGNLSNIQSGMAQQNLNILNSALSPQNYAAAVYQSQSAQAQANQAQIGSIVASMKNVQQRIPIIQAQQAQMAGISGNVGGFQLLSAQLTTLEKQNQQMLAAIQQAQLQKASVTATTLSTQQALSNSQQANNQYENAVTAAMQSAIPASTASAARADLNLNNRYSCIASGGTIMTCP